MIKIGRRTVILMVGALLFMFEAGASQAAPQIFKVLLAGAQEVPPVESAGKGVANLTYDPATRVITWTISYQGLSGAVTMGHFHGPAAQGESASPQLWLTVKDAAVENPIKGQATLTPEQAKDLAAGKWYVNLHTAAHPAGEVRGQVILPKS
jgi:CHRD domain